MICIVGRVVDTHGAPDWVSSSAGGSDLDSRIEVKRLHYHRVDWPPPGSDLANSRVDASCHLVPLLGQVVVLVSILDSGSDCASE